MILDLDKNGAFGEDGTGILYIATDYDGAVFDETNTPASITAIEADYTFGDVGYFENFAPYVKKGEERIIMTDYCGVGEISRKLEQIGGFTADVQEILAMDNLALMLSATLETVAPASGIKGQEIINLKRKLKTNAYQLFKFVSCPNELGLSNIFYFVKAVMASDITIPYTNLAKDDFTGVSIDMEVARGGNTLIKKETSVALV